MHRHAAVRNAFGSGSMNSYAVTINGVRLMSLLTFPLWPRIRGAIGQACLALIKVHEWKSELFSAFESNPPRLVNTGCRIEWDLEFPSL